MRTARAVAALAILAGLSSPARARTTAQADLDQNGFKLYGLPLIPDRASGAVPLQFVTPGAGYLKSSALNGSVTAVPTIPGTDITTNTVPLSGLVQVPGLTVLGNAGSSTANVANVTATGGLQFLATNGAGTALAFTSTIAATSAPLTATQVGYGNGSNLLTGSNNFTFASASSQMKLLGDATTGEPGVTYRRSRGTVASPAIITNTDYVWRQYGEAYDGTGWTRTGEMGVHVLPGSTPSAGSVGTEWYVKTGTTDSFAGGGANAALVASGSTVSVGFNPVGSQTPGTSTGALLQVYGTAQASKVVAGTSRSFNPPFKLSVVNTPGTDDAYFYLTSDRAAATGAAVMILLNDRDVSFPSSFGLYSSASTVYGGAAANSIILDNSTGGNFIVGSQGTQAYATFDLQTGKFQVVDSSGSVSASATSAIRSNGHKLQYSQNGGAWANFDDIGSGAFVPLTRTLTPDIGILIDGGTSAVSLSANRTIGARYDNVSITANGGGALQRGAISGDGSVAAGANTFTLSNIPNATTMAGRLVATAIAAPAAPGAGLGAIYFNSTSKNIEVKDDAGVVKHGVQTAAAVSNQFVTAISDSGVVSQAQPSYSNLSGSVPAITQLTGDVNAGPGSGSQVATVINLPTGVTMAGRLVATAIAAPSTPSAGIGAIYVDSTSKNLAVKDDAGVVKHGVQTSAAVASNFVTAISDAGAVSRAQPVEADVVNLVTDLAGKVPTTRTLTAGAGMTGGGDLSADRTFDVVANADGTIIVNTNDVQVGVIGTGNIANNAVTYGKVQQVAAVTLLGNPTGSTANVSGVTLGSGLAFLGTTLVATGGGGSVTTVTGTAPIFITSTPTTTPNVTIQGAVTTGGTSTSATNLGALGAGILGHTVSSGVSTPVHILESTGLTLASSTLTANLSTGVPGGQTARGGTAAGETLTLQSTTNAAKGKIILGTATATNWFNEANIVSDNPILSIGETSAALTTSIAQFSRVSNNGAYVNVNNSNAGGSASAGFTATQSASAYGINYFVFELEGSARSTSGPIVANAAIYEHVNNTSAPMIFSEFSGGDIGFYTTASRSDRMQIKNNGDVTIGTGLATNATSGFIYYPAATGTPTGVPTTRSSGNVIPTMFDRSNDRLYAYDTSWRLIGQYTGTLANGPLCNTTSTGLWGHCSSADVAGTIGFPAADEVLVSTGASTAPGGSSEFQYDRANDVLKLGSADMAIAQGGLSIYNVGTAGSSNYERMVLYRVSNTFHIDSAAGGTGTARNMTVSAGTANLTMNGGTITADSGAASTAVTPTGVLLFSNPSFVSSSSLSYGGVSIYTPVTLTGGTSVTTANGLNGTEVLRPIYTSPTATNITSAATVAIRGEPIAAGGVSITNPYPLWVQSGTIRLDSALQNPGGGPGATLGTTGGSGPTTAAQAKWLPINSGGTTYWIPAFQ